MNYSSGDKLRGCSYGRMILLACGVALAAVFAGCHKASDLRGAERMSVISGDYYKYNKKLKVGMSKDGVIALLGPPDNLDPLTVWVYSDGEIGNWRSMVFGRPALYIIFYNDKLVTSGFVKAAAENPWDTMRRCLPLSDEEVSKILGQKPKGVE